MKKQLDLEEIFQKMGLEFPKEQSPRIAFYHSKKGEKMNTVKLSNNGIIIIPELLLQTYSWKEGQEFVLEETQQGLLLKPKSYFPPTTIEEVAGCLAYRGEPKSQSDYEEAIQKGITEEWNGIG